MQEKTLIPLHRLSVRTRNCLEATGLLHFEDLPAQTEDLLKIRSFGAGCLREIQEFLEAQKNVQSSVCSQEPEGEEYESESEIGKSFELPLSLFSVRTRNCLSRLGITTQEQLFVMWEQLLAVKGFGTKCESELRPYREKAAETASSAAHLQSIRPGWLLEQDSDEPLPFLSMSARLKNCLQSNGYIKYGDLPDMLDGLKEKIKNFGDTSLDELKSVLKKEFYEEKPTFINERSELRYHYLWVYFKESCRNQYTEWDRVEEILIQRYYWDKTLDEVGQEIDVTRERVRQIQKGPIKLFLSRYTEECACLSKMVMKLLETKPEERLDYEEAVTLFEADTDEKEQSLKILLRIVSEQIDSGNQSLIHEGGFNFKKKSSFIKKIRSACTIVDKKNSGLFKRK